MTELVSPPKEIGKLAEDTVTNRTNGIVCEMCKRIFEPHNRNRVDAKFCSSSCRVRWHRTEDGKNAQAERQRRRRTSQQNRAMHKWFSLVATALNDSGRTVAMTLRHDVDVPWNGTLVKELIYRPVMQTMTGNQSTTQLNTKDPSEIYEVLNLHLGEKLGIHIPFPSEETR